MVLSMTRRDVLKVGCGLGLSAALAACAPKVTEDTAAADKQATAPVVEAAAEGAKPAGEPLTLYFSIKSGSNELYDARLAVYKDEQPDIKVEYVPIPREEYTVKIQTMTAAKTLPDLAWTCVTWCDHQWMIKEGALLEVGSWLEANNKSRDEWGAAAVESISADGNMYGIPMCCHPGHSFLYINKDYFEDAGIPIPDVLNENTPDDIIEWSRKVASGAKDNRDVYGYLAQMKDLESWLAPARTFGAATFTEDGTTSLLDSDEWWAWAQWMETLQKEALAPSIAQLPKNAEPSLFVSGKVAMLNGPRGNWTTIVKGFAEQSSTVEWTVVRMPRHPNYLKWPAGIDTTAPTATTQYPEEVTHLSYSFADWTSSKLWYEVTGRVSARVDDFENFVEKTDNEFVKLGYQLQLDEQPILLPGNLRMREVEDAMLNAWSGFWSSDEPVTRDMVKEVKAVVDGILAKPEI